MKTIFFDVDNQIDFLYPAGALYVPGAEDLVKGVAELTNFASANQIQIISTADAHSENDPEFKAWKPHCVVETTGQRKAVGTLLPNAAVLSTAPNAFEAAANTFINAPQIIVEKQNIDCFTNPNLRPLLTQLKAERYVVYGVVTEVCVRCAVLGLLETGARVELVTDAIKSLSQEAERETIKEFEARGGVLASLSRCTL